MKTKDITITKELIKQRIIKELKNDFVYPDINDLIDEKVDYIMNHLYGVILDVWMK